MANMNEIKDRISGIKDIMKITNAMYLISSSKLKKARANWEAMQPYFDNIQATVHHVLEHTEEFSHPYFDNGKDKPDDQKKYARAFYCQGGLDYDKMSLGSKMLMKTFAAMLKSKKTKDEDEKAMIEAISESHDFSNPKYIEPIVAYMKK